VFEYVMIPCVALLRCINLEVNNIYSYVNANELSHIQHGVKHSCYPIFYKEVKLSHMYYWDVIPPFLLVYNRDMRDPCDTQKHCNEGSHSDHILCNDVNMECDVWEVLSSVRWYFWGIKKTIPSCGCFPILEFYHVYQLYYHFSLVSFLLWLYVVIWIGG